MAAGAREKQKTASARGKQRSPLPLLKPNRLAGRKIKRGRQKNTSPVHG